SQQFDDDRFRFSGCAITDFASGNRLYVANFNEEKVEVYDGGFQPVNLAAGAFRYPDQPDGFVPWNIAYFHTCPNHEGRVWVTYTLKEEPWEEDPAFGAVAEFDLDGHFIRRVTTSLDTDPYADSELRDPWGIAIAPGNFGPLSGKLLVANFGD